MVSVQKHEGIGGTLPRIEPSGSNRDAFSKVARMLNDVSTCQGGRFRRVVG